MINVLRSEWIKLRTVKMNWILGGIALAFPLLVTLLTAYFSGDDEGVDARSLVELLTGTSVVATLLCGMIAAASITSEFGFGTIRPTFAAVPRRLRVIVGKGLVAVCAAMVLVTIVVLIGVFVGRPLAEGQGATIDFDRYSGIVPALLGTILLARLTSLAGYGLGLLTRSTPAAISILIVWPLIAEGLIGGVLGETSPSTSILWRRPFQSGIRMVFVEYLDVGGPSRVVSGFYFGGVAALLAAVGGWAVNRRDA